MSSEIKKQRGGKRPNAGRLRQRIVLSPAQARTLALLVSEKRALLNRPDLSEQEVLASLIEQEWHSGTG